MASPAVVLVRRVEGGAVARGCGLAFCHSLAEGESFWEGWSLTGLHCGEGGRLRLCLAG